MELHYQGLLDELQLLRSHFELCEGADNREVLDWARFFRQWSEKTLGEGVDWSRENLGVADKIVRALERPKAGIQGFKALSIAMQKATSDLAGSLRAWEPKAPGALEVDPGDFREDVDAPRVRRVVSA
jgi:hypothetical protein